MKKRTKIMSTFILLALVVVGVLQFKKMNEEALIQKEKEKIEQEKARIAKETALEEARIAREAEGKPTFTSERELTKIEEFKIFKQKHEEDKFFDIARIRSWELGNNLVASYSIIYKDLKYILMLKKLIKRQGAPPLFVFLDYLILDNNRTIASIKNCRKDGVIDKNLVGFYDTLKYMNEPEVSEFIKMYRFNLEARKIVEVEQLDGIECDNPHIENIEKMVEESYINWIDGSDIVFNYKELDLEKYKSFSRLDKYDINININMDFDYDGGHALYTDWKNQKAVFLLMKPIDNFTHGGLAPINIILDSKEIKYEEGLRSLNYCEKEVGIRDRNIIGIFDKKFLENEWISDFKYVLYADYLNDRLVEISTAGIKCKNEDYIKYIEKREKKEKIEKLQQEFPEKYPKFVDGKQVFNSIFELEDYDEEVYEFRRGSSTKEGNHFFFLMEKENILKGRVVLSKKVYSFGEDLDNKSFYIILDEVEFKLNENPPASFNVKKDFGYDEWFANSCFKDGIISEYTFGIYFEQENYDFQVQGHSPNMRKIYFFNIELGKIEEIKNHDGFTCVLLEFY